MTRARTRAYCSHYSLLQRHRVKWILRHWDAVGSAFTWSLLSRLAMWVKSVVFARSLRSPFSDALQRQDGHRARSPSISGLTNLDKQPPEILRSKVVHPGSSGFQSNPGCLWESAAILQSCDLHLSLSQHRAAFQAFARAKRCAHSTVAALCCKHLCIEPV
jgi:hypothetical protein